jgi:hypothetical protein
VHGSFNNILLIVIPRIRFGYLCEEDLWLDARYCTLLATGQRQVHQEQEHLGGGIQLCIDEP